LKIITLDELKKIEEGRILTWDSNKPVKYIAKNPEEIGEYCLYFFSEDENENNVLLKMASNNASGIVVRRPCLLDVNRWKEAGIGIIETGNTIMFQIALARIYRTKFDIPVIQVIGSAGKTTTKDMIGSVLAAGMPVLAGYKNYNTAFGVAYNLLNVRKHHKAIVVEAGMKSKGYMDFSSSIIKPTIAVLTSIQRAHYVLMGSIENIIEAKAEILNHIDKNGLLVINGEDPNCDKFPVERFSGRVVRYGFSDKFDVWTPEIEYKDFKSYFKVISKHGETECVINTVGKYNVGNALAAFAVGLELGLSPDVIRRGLAVFKPMSRRLKMLPGPNETLIIDDNFNANPDSTQLLLEEIPKFSSNRPVILVMGDVERPDDKISDYAKEVHFSIGKQAAKVNFERFIAIGKWAKEYIAGAESEGAPADKMAHFDTVEQAVDYFKSAVQPGSVLIFKASVYVNVRDLIKFI
jgi:UDP-N-acetylmuramoyl-tripeptide--D-alanyl-D-alanine ligase